MTKRKKYTIFLLSEILEKVRQKAFELGYVWNRKGSISRLLIGIGTGEVILRKAKINYEKVKKENK